MIEQAHSNPFLLVEFSHGLGEEGIVVAESGERLAFRHGLIRDAEQASIPEAARTLDRHGAKVLPARRALSVEFATVSSLRVKSRVELTSVAADWTSPERAMHGGAAPVTLASRYAVS
jgi:hypothetical protein